MDILTIVGYIVDAVLFIVHIVSVIMCVCGVHTLCKHDKNDNKEISNMKYRIPSYREESPAESQSFNPLVKQFRFNKSTGELEELPDMLDVQKLVDSSLSTSLEAMFDKFLSPDPQSVAETVLDDKRDLLDRLTDALDFSEELKDKLQMDEFASLSDVKARLESDISAQLEKVNAEKEAELSKQVDVELFNKFKAFMAQAAEGEKNA